MTKIVFIGAGSVVFNKNLLGDILSMPELQDCIISLNDIDPIRLETAEALARGIAAGLDARPVIEAEASLPRCLEGASYIINLIGVGGHAATLIDFEIPRKYGLRQTIGDSHGIGGMFRALRTIPVMSSIAREIEQISPDALFLNYTNPMSMLVWYLFTTSKVRTVGLCHSVQGTARQLAHYIGIPFEQLTYLAAGINHMSWILKLEYQGQDVYPLLRQAIEESRLPKTDMVRAEFFNRLGYFVTESSEHMAEYSPFFIRHPTEVIRFNVPLDEYIRRSERGLKEFEILRNKVMAGEPFEVRRSSEYAAEIIHASETKQPAVIYGNVRNDNLIDNLPAGCCVEVPCLVDTNGVQPVRVGPLPPQLAAMCRPHTSVQELTVRAAVEGRREFLYQAAMMDPLVSASLTLDQIWSMVDEMIAAHGPALPEALRDSQPAATTFFTQTPDILKN